MDTELPLLPDLTVAEVTITVPVRNADAAEHRATVTTSFDGIRVSRTVTVPTGEETEVTFAAGAYQQLQLQEPKLWRPNGLPQSVAQVRHLTRTCPGLPRAEVDGLGVCVGGRGERQWCVVLVAEPSHAEACGAPVAFGAVRLGDQGQFVQVWLATWEAALSLEEQAADAENVAGTGQRQVEDLPSSREREVDLAEFGTRDVFQPRGAGLRRTAELRPPSSAHPSPRTVRPVLP